MPKRGSSDSEISDGTGVFLASSSFKAVNQRRCSETLGSQSTGAVRDVLINGSFSNSTGQTRLPLKKTYDALADIKYSRNS